MIELVQPGVAGKTDLLLDMHRLRTRIFKRRLNWDVSVDSDGLEVDEFDLPEAVYLLSLNSDRRVNGAWRMLPTDGPTMIRDIWPEFLTTLPMPVSQTVWELSRFAVDPLSSDPRAAMIESHHAVAEMFCGLTEICMRVGIEEVFTLYDARIARVIRRINCQPAALSASRMIDGVPCQIGSFSTNAAMLSRLRQATGITNPILSNVQTPPRLLNLTNERGLLRA